MIVLTYDADPTAPSIVLVSDYVHVEPPVAAAASGIDLRYASTSTLGLIVGIP